MILKRKFHLLIVASLFIGTLLSCGHQSDSRLHAAEMLMEEAPDSALYILDSIPIASLGGDSDKALYGLLLTQAKDKNYLNPTDDSIIAFSVDYYSNGKDAVRETMANYYQGRVYYHADNKARAIVSYFRAKELAENTGEYFWAGMACRGISDIYNATYNTSEELAYAQKEYEYIKKSGRQPYMNYAILDYANALFNNNHIENTLLRVEEVCDSARMNGDSFLLHSALQLKIESLISSGKYGDVLPLTVELCKSDLAQPKDSANLAMALVKNGFYNEASKLIDEISDCEISKSYVKYEIATHEEDYAAANAELQKLNSLVYTDYRNAVRHDLTSNLADYFELRRDIDNERLKSSRLLNIIIIVGSLILLLSIVLIAIYIVKARNKKIEEKVLFAERLQESLYKRDLENANSSRIIRELLSTKYSLLENFCSIVLVNTNTNKSNQKIADAVTKLIRDLTIDKIKIAELEKEIDYMQNNLMSDFRRDLPDLKESDYRMFLFSIFGLSNDTMMLLLQEEKILAIYNRKKRLKTKIKTLEESKRERYMQYFR